MNSLQHRFLLASALILVGTIFLLGLSLEKAMKKSLIQAQADKMKGVIYAVLGAMEVDEKGEVILDVPERVDARLVQPESDLSVVVRSLQGKGGWSSPSAEEEANLHHGANIGEWRFEPSYASRPPTFYLSYGVQWLGEQSKKTSAWIVTVREKGYSFERQIRTFRKTMWGWLSASAVLLLFLEIAVMRWGFAPLKGFALQLDEVRKGKREEISGSVPKELSEVQEGLNTLLRHERSQQKRYRNALGDLAHSLKTPLAVLRGNSSSEIKDQVDRMDRIVGYQVRRAATVGRQAFAQAISPRTVAQQLVDAMKKVHQEKSIQFTLSIEESVKVRMDEGDFFELFGNVIDNASKWCTSRVHISASIEGELFNVLIEDDGPGFPNEPEKLLKRGVRADSKMEGQGIGLSIVDEMVSIYEGSIQLDRSSLGGAKVSLQLPVA